MTVRFQHATSLTKIWRLRYLLRCPLNFLKFWRRPELSAAQAWQIAIDIAHFQMNWVYSWPIMDLAEFYPEDREDQIEKRLSA